MKKTLRNKKSKDKNKTKRKNKQNRKNNKSKYFFNKKSNKIMGGNINPSSFQEFQSYDNKYYYGLNNYNNDPNNSDNIISSRNQSCITGGKKRKGKGNKTMRNRMIGNHMKGGSSVGNIFNFSNPILGTSLNSPMMSFGTYDGATKMGSSIITGTTATNNDVTNQPAYHTYNSYSSPLA